MFILIILYPYCVHINIYCRNIENKIFTQSKHFKVICRTIQNLTLLNPYYKLILNHFNEIKIAPV